MAPPPNRRPGFSRRAQYGLFISYVVAVGGALVGACLLLLSTFNPPAFAAVRGFFSEIVTPIASGLDWTRRGVSGIPGGIASYFGVRSENAALRAQVERDRALVDQARAITNENRRLRAMLRLRDRTAEPVVAARLVYSSASSTRRFAVLNAGSWQGVRTGMPVRGPNGLIGRVVEVSPNTARVLLILDPESIVPVRRVRDGLPAIAAGRGDGLLEIRSASAAQAQFEAGDAFVTSGVGGVFPPNIAVGRVSRRARDLAEAAPLASPDTLDFALVQQMFLPEAGQVRAPEAAPR
ncbi:rod shape-determining protein MreC [Sphingomonas turrisvirgatae]|uniref:Cell shape-determining protein MreC n=1 Tax=Sphingomonas turrisvirgatae TaxID=1888892 RepID=A0A1E3LRG1_9SPHN|nr:rod shape-determining protein MreC [Sphingomonas turrisvirgatae]ODP36351.1 rod shape-determining protein MreC [Sphingomonas turrisvirgatae]